MPKIIILSLVAMYMFDETDINQYIQKIRDERFVVGLVYIDNYEDALESVDDVRRSLFVGLVDKRVNKYFSAGAAIIRKLEKDKYLVVFRYKFLEKLLADKFSLVEDIKSVKVGNEKDTYIKYCHRNWCGWIMPEIMILPRRLWIWHLDVEVTRQLSKMVRRYTIMVERASRWRRIHE